MGFLDHQGRKSPSLSCKPSNNRINAGFLLSLLHELIAALVGQLMLGGFSAGARKIRVRGASYQSRTAHKIYSSICYLLTPVTEAGVAAPGQCCASGGASTSSG